MKFIVIQNKTKAEELINKGCKPVSMHDNIFVFEVSQFISKFCEEKLQKSDYILTNTLII